MTGRADVGAAIKTARLSVGLTQAQVSRALGIERSQVVAWEESGDVPDGVMLARLCAISPDGGKAILDAIIGDWMVPDRYRSQINRSLSNIPDTITVTRKDWEAKWGLSTASASNPEEAIDELLFNGASELYYRTDGDPNQDVSRVLIFQYGDAPRS